MNSQEPDLQEQRANVLALCVEHLGEHAGRQLAALARPGVRLDAVDDEEFAAGECGVGGPALLEPGTPWPEYEGIPLSLLAVLDTDALAPELGDQLPCRPGLLNFFYFDPDFSYEERQRLPDDHFEDPRTWRVIPADPARCDEVMAPDLARTYAWSPLCATPMITLPEVEQEIVQRLDFGAGHEDFPPLPDLYAIKDAWRSSGAHQMDSGAHQAFGWPSLLQGGVMPEEGTHTHLLQIDPFDQWSFGDAGVVYFTIPTEALRSGDFSQVSFNGQSC